ncbi:hypothetical protein IWZ00DRAFT_379585 [Phyllosticta capitalensis]
MMRHPSRQRRVFTRWRLYFGIRLDRVWAAEIFRTILSSFGNSFEHKTRLTMAAPVFAARRALVPLHSSLCPFLYRTRTILGHHTSIQPPRWHVQKRHLRVVNELGRVVREEDGERQASASPKDDFDFEIPFEDEKDRPIALHERTDTSVTATEREAFKKLFEKYTSRAKENPQDPFEFSDKNTLDEILAEATGRSGKEPDLATGLKSPMGDLTATRRKEYKVTNRYTVLRHKQQSQHDRVVAKFLKAKSDIELWNILEREVFSIIRRLDLDEPGMLESAMDQPKSTSGDKNMDFSELEIIGPNYPTFLLHFMRQLRVDFPTSTLAMSVLPAVKSLGRESFALGVSTELYNELIAITWLTFADFESIDEILTEMKEGGIRFDQATYDMIRSIVFTARKAPAFQPGTLFRNEIRSLDRFEHGRERLFTWGKKMREKLDLEAIMQARAKRIDVAGFGDVL